MNKLSLSSFLSRRRSRRLLLRLIADRQKRDIRSEHTFSKTVGCFIVFLGFNMWLTLLRGQNDLLSWILQDTANLPASTESIASNLLDFCSTTNIILSLVSSRLSYVIYGTRLLIYIYIELYAHIVLSRCQSSICRSYAPRNK